MVCHLCYPEAKEIGEIVPNLWLMENQGKYAIMGSPGHKRHELFFFPDKPSPDPDPDNLLEETDPLFEISLKWTDVVSDWSETIRLYPEDGYLLYSGAEKAGWKDGMLLFWLYNRAGEMVKKHEEEVRKK